MDADEVRLFGDSLRQALGQRRDADAALAEVGWLTALADDPGAATRVVFDLLGELNLVSTALDDLLTYALGLTPSSDLAIVLPSLGSHTPPAAYDRAEITVSGIGTSRIATATQAIVCIDAGDQAYLTRISPDVLEITAAIGIDPEAGWRVVRGAVKVSEIAGARWGDAVATGQLALAQQLTATARVMLGQAREHATTRTQFDRPIAGFQAVRHKLAECLVAVEAAEAALATAWDDPTPFAATMAKALAGTATATVGRHAQQVLAGMGFTADHPFHRYLKRSMVLAALLGSSANLRSELGQAAMKSHHAPTLTPL